jgi:hypothetical protein
VALAQARAAGVFTATHQQFWDHVRRCLGDAAGTRALCKVLLLHRHLPAEVVAAGMQAALGAGSVDPEVVAIEARAAADRRSPATVVPIGAARCDQRPAPVLDGYDGLLVAGGAR